MNKEEFKHGLALVSRKLFLQGDGFEVEHICLYPEQPTIREYYELYHELNNDPELGFYDKGIGEYILLPASQAMLDYYLAQNTEMTAI